MSAPTVRPEVGTERLLGLDLGATLTKIVLLDEEGRWTRHERFANRPAQELIAYLDELAPSRIGVTGGGGAELLAAFEAGDRILPTRQVSEFEAWGRGVSRVATRAGQELPEAFLLVSLGTGTSILEIRGDACRRVGGSALGGGTFLGLGRLLAGAENFGEMAHLARLGDRARVDLLVGDIYRHARPALPGGGTLPAEINAASFGKLASRQREDLAHAVAGLVGENIVLVASALAAGAGIRSVLFCGSTLEANPSLIEIVDATARALGLEPHFLTDGAYCGAAGAAL